MHSLIYEQRQNNWRTLHGVLLLTVIAPWLRCYTLLIQLLLHLYTWPEFYCHLSRPHHLRLFRPVVEQVQKLQISLGHQAHGNCSSNVAWRIFKVDILIAFYGLSSHIFMQKLPI